MLSALPGLFQHSQGWLAVPGAQKHSQSRQKTFTSKRLGYIPGFEFDLPAKKEEPKNALGCFFAVFHLEVTFIGGRKTQCTVIFAFSRLNERFGRAHT